MFQQTFIKEEIDIPSDPIDHDPDYEDDERMADYYCDADHSGSEDSDASCIIVNNEKSIPSFVFVKMENDESVISSFINEEHRENVVYDGDCGSNVLRESIQVGPNRAGVPSCRLQDDYSNGGKQRSAVALPLEQPQPDSICSVLHNIQVQAKSSVGRWKTEHFGDCGPEPNKETPVSVNSCSATKNASHMIKHRPNITADEPSWPNLTETIIKLHSLVSQEEDTDKLAIYNTILTLGRSLQNPYKINYYGVEPNFSDIHTNLLDLYKTSLRPHIFSDITLLILDLFRFVSGDKMVNNLPDFEPNSLYITSGKMFKNSQTMRETGYFTKPWDIRLREGIKGVQPVVVKKATKIKKQQTKNVKKGLNSSAKNVSATKIVRLNEKLANSSNEVKKKPHTNSSESVKRKQARKRLQERKLQWKQLFFKEEEKNNEIKRGKIKKKVDRVKQPAHLKGGAVKKVHRAVGKSMNSNSVVKSFDCLQCSVNFTTMYDYERHQCLLKGSIVNDSESDGNTELNSYKCGGIRQPKEFEVEESDLLAGETILSGSSEMYNVLSNNNSDSEGSECIFETGKRLSKAETGVNCASISEIKSLQSELKLFKSENKTRHCLKIINTERAETKRAVKGDQIKTRKSQRNGNFNNNESGKRLYKQSPTKPSISKNKSESQNVNYFSAILFCSNQSGTKKSSRILKSKQENESAIKPILKKLNKIKTGSNVPCEHKTNLTVQTVTKVKSNSELHFQTDECDGVRQLEGTELEEIGKKDITVAGETVLIDSSKMCNILSNNNSDSEGSECVFETGKRLSEAETGGNCAPVSKLKSLQSERKLFENENKTGHCLKINTERWETIKKKIDAEKDQNKIRKSQRNRNLNKNESGKCPYRHSPTKLSTSKNKNKSQNVNHISARMFSPNQRGPKTRSGVLNSEQESALKTKFETLSAVKSGTNVLFKDGTNLSVEHTSTKVKCGSELHFQTDGNTKDDVVHGIANFTDSCFDGNSDSSNKYDSIWQPYEIEEKDLIAGETVLNGSSEMCEVRSINNSDSEGSECVFETGKRLRRAETGVNCVQVSKIKLQSECKLFETENSMRHCLKKTNENNEKQRETIKTKREVKGDQVKIRKSLQNGNWNSNVSKRPPKKSPTKLYASKKKNKSPKANHTSVRVFGLNQKGTKIGTTILKSNQEKGSAVKTTFEKLSAVKSGSSVLFENGTNLMVENVNTEVKCSAEFHFQADYNAKEDVVHGDSDDENKLIINEDVNELIYDTDDDIITISD